MAELQTKPHADGQLAEAPRNAKAKCQQEAQVYEQRHASTVLAALGKKLSKHVSPGGFALYLQSVLGKAADPTDPLERMLIEELVWLHQRIGDLHMTAAGAATPELVNVLNAAVTKLAAEFRKSVLALRVYRNPMPSPQVTVIGQQNLSARDQQIALVEQPAAAPGPGKKSRDIELVSKQELLGHVEPSLPFASANCREGEPLQTQGAFARSTAETARGGIPQSALEVVHGSKNGSR